MKFIIKIKRDTIKPNPNKGRDAYQVAGRSCTEVKRFIRRGNDVVFQCLTDGHITYELTYLGRDSEDLPKLSHAGYVGLMKGEISEVIVEQSSTRDINIVRTMTPERSYLFDYEDTQVECHACYARFAFKDLKADAMASGDDEIWSNGICPKCDAWDCCEIEFESINDVLTKEPS